MVILAIAILAIGPKRMVEIARTLGRATSKLRKISSEFMAIIQAELRETEASARDLVDGTVAGEAGVEGEVQATGRQAKGTVESLKEEIGLASLQAELRETERAAREFMEKVAQEDEEEEEQGLAAAEEAPEEAEPEAERAKPADTTAPEQALPEQVSGEPEALTALEAAEEPRETPGTALILASSRGEPAEPAGEEAPAIEPAATEAAAPEDVPEEQPVPQVADGTGSELQEAVPETTVATRPAPESEPGETEAGAQEDSGGQIAEPEPAFEASDWSPVAVSEGQEGAEPPVAAEDAKPPGDAEVPEEQPLSPEEEARVHEAVARAAGLIEPDQTEAEKADENDRQE
jgi:Sec-independent protein translocase protein TatA